MGKMSEIAMMLENGDEKGLVEFFGKEGWRKSVANIGGKEFIKAFDEIREAKKKAIIKIDDQSKDVRKNIAEMSEDEWQNYLKQMDGSNE